MKTARIAAGLLASGILVLAACSKEEPAPAESAPEIDNAPVSEEVPAADEAATPATDENPVEVVEESAADPGSDGSDRILLAQADSAGSAKNYKYKEGVNYVRLVPTQPTVGGADKIEVAEFFWYGCPHCYDLEPALSKWAEGIPPTVRFVRVPAMWNPLVRLHAQLYYTEEVLERNGVIKDSAAFRKNVFEEYHQRGNRLVNEDAIRSLFERFGVSDEEFGKTWGSFEVAQKMRVAEDLARRYSVASVPTIVVNGKYRTSGAEAGSYPKLIEVIDELIDRESAR